MVSRVRRLGQARLLLENVLAFLLLAPADTLMPELAEVETVVRGLRPLAGRVVLDVRFGRTDFIDDPDRLAAALPGSCLVEIRRHGKFILAALEKSGEPHEKSWLLIHLGMTGQLVVRSPGDPESPHTHLRLSLDDGRELRYVDIRRFGRIALATAAELAARLAPLGADPLELTQPAFRRRFRPHAARLKALLLDQSVLRGLGNIYADESLWRARLHPLRQASDLSNTEIARLWRCIRQVLREAIRHGGTSISDYVNAAGLPGSYQKCLRVYRRTGRPCPRCRRKIQRIIVAGRSSHFCPRCQPPPA